jgi:hypothetical protein
MDSSGTVLSSRSIEVEHTDKIRTPRKKTAPNLPFENFSNIPRLLDRRRAGEIPFFFKRDARKLANYAMEKITFYIMFIDIMFLGKGCQYF